MLLLGRRSLESTRPLAFSHEEICFDLPFTRRRICSSQRRSWCRARSRPRYWRFARFSRPASCWPPCGPGSRYARWTRCSGASPSASSTASTRSYWPADFYRPRSARSSPSSISNCSNRTRSARNTSRSWPRRRGY